MRDVHALRSAGCSVKQIVADIGISRASVYRALALIAAYGDADTDAEGSN